MSTSSSLSLAQTEQLRRDAKRLSNSEGIPYSAALDRLALAKGQRNWSQLMRNASSSESTAHLNSDSKVPPSEPLFASKALSSETLDALFNAFQKMRPASEGPYATREEVALLFAIAERFERLVRGSVPLSRLDIFLALETCHSLVCPLNLEALAGPARDIDVSHDVAGILRHLNQETNRLDDLFWPRYARG